MPKSGNHLSPLVLFVMATGISLLSACHRQPKQVPASNTVEEQGREKADAILQEPLQEEGSSNDLVHIKRQSKAGAGASVVDLWLPRQQPLCDSVYSWFMEVDPTFSCSAERYTPEGLNDSIDKVFKISPGVDDDVIEAYLDVLCEDDAFVTFIHRSYWGWSPFGGETIHGATFRKSDGRHLRYKDYFRNADGVKAYLLPFNRLKWDNSDFVPDSIFAAYDAPFPLQDIWLDHDSIRFVWPRYSLGYGYDGNIVRSMSIDKAAELMSPAGLSFLKLTAPKSRARRSLPRHFKYRTFSYDLIGMDIEIPEFMTLRSTVIDSTIVFAFNDYNYMHVTIYPADSTEAPFDYCKPSETFYQVKKDNWRVSSNYSTVYSKNDQLVYQKEIWRRDSYLVCFTLHYETAHRKTFDGIIERMLKPLTAD